jgi:HK97 family phage major capsid protein
MEEKIKLEKFEEKLSELVSTKINEAVEKIGLMKIDRKYGIFPSEGDVNGKDLKELTKDQRISKFIKAVMRKDLPTIGALSTKALSEGTGTAGGFLVPEEFRAEVIRLVEKYGIIRRLATVIPMKRDVMNIPSLTGGISVSWVDEGVVIPESTPSFGQKVLTAKKLVGLTRSSSELLDDAEVDVIALLNELFAEAIAREEDYQGLRGVGTPITGVLGDAGCNVVTMGATKVNFSDITSDNLSDLIDSVTASGQVNAKFTFHRNIMNHIRKLKDSTGQNIWQMTHGDAPATIWGYPYEITDVMPGNSESAVSTKFIMFGNLKNFYLGDRKELALSISEEATVGGQSMYERDQKAIRLIERIAGVVANPTAFGVLRTAAV